MKTFITMIFCLFTVTAVAAPIHDAVISGDADRVTGLIQNPPRCTVASARGPGCGGIPPLASGTAAYGRALGVHRPASRGAEIAVGNRRTAGGGAGAGRDHARGGSGGGMDPTPGSLASIGQFRVCEQ